MSDMQAWGARIREAQDAAGEKAHDLAVARARLLTAEHAPRRSKRAAWSGASLALAACAAALVLWWPRTDTLTFRVAERRGEVLTWLESQPVTDLPVRFSDGSSLLLRKQTRARIERVGARGASVALQRGEIAVSVVHQADTHWSIQAGPYRVDVIGTRFDVAFEPSEQAFSLDLHDGSVRLEGPGLEPGRTIVAGQRVALRHGTADTQRVSAADKQADDRPTQADAHATENPASSPREPSEPAEAQHQDVPAAPLAVPLSQGQRPLGASPGWLSLATRGDYAGALREAERHGLAAVLRGAKVDDLLLLGDCAFYAQRDAMAKQIYGTVRARAPRGVQAAIAAFNLGRLSFRSEPSALEAALWFRCYLAEQPRGELRREALGRLLEAERESGQLAAARQSAEIYLRDYPTGPHALVAREVMLAPER